MNIKYLGFLPLIITYSALGLYLLKGYKLDRDGFVGLFYVMVAMVFTVMTIGIVLFSVKWAMTP